VQARRSCGGTPSGPRLQPCPALWPLPGWAAQEVWSEVATKQDKLASDEEALKLAQGLLQRHQSEVADDAAPLK
jgi:hypothetical protein